MKECPKCKAKIQQEARFCLYCMTSFEQKQTIAYFKEKNRRWLYIIATVFAFVTIAAIISILGGTDDAPKEKNNNKSDTVSAGVVSDFASLKDKLQQTQLPQFENNIAPDTPNSDNAQGDSQTNQSPTTTPPTNNTTPPTNDTPQKEPEVTTPSTNDTPQKQPEVTTPPTNDTPQKEPEVTTPPTNDTPQKEPEVTTPPTNDDTNEQESDSQPKYEYIEATVENTYPKGYTPYSPPENCVVITKVLYKEKNGNYIIPETIDGKRVAAIMPSAFSDPSISSLVKSVTLPKTIRRLHAGAFENCFNLTDLYLKSVVIEIYPDTFPSVEKRNGKLTFHCSKDCRNFDYYYYRNIIGKYGAEYIEWNG